MARVSLCAIFIVLCVAAFANADGHKDNFFQYANVPGWGQYEFGYHRGNKDHFTSRFEKAHGWTFKTKVRWGDKHGWGESYWDYNHTDKNKKHGGWEQPKHHGWQPHHGHGGGGGGGGGGQGAFSENVPVINRRGDEEMSEQPTQMTPQRVVMNQNNMRNNLQPILGRQRLRPLYPASRQHRQNYQFL